MKGKRFFAMLVKLIQLYQIPYFQGAGAQLAFYLVMSLVPLMVLLLQVGAVFAITPEVVEQLAQDYLSEQAMAVIQKGAVHIQESGSGAFGLVTLFVTLWAASKIQFCIVGICNYAYSGKVRIRGFLWERIRAIINVTLLLLVIVASLIALVYGKVILGIITVFVEKSLHLSFQLNHVWYIVRWPIAIAVYVAVISYLYYMSPDKKPRLFQVIPGSVFASIAMVITSLGYSVYVSAFANFDALYGSLASFVALLFWFYLLGTIFVLGILFNLAWEETKDITS